MPRISRNSAQAPNNVYDFFSDRPRRRQAPLLRLSPELDGLALLFTSRCRSHQYYSMKILCWGIRADGSIDALAPWLAGVHSAGEISSDNLGSWKGFYNPATRRTFCEVPPHKQAELELAVSFFAADQHSDDIPLQEFPDQLGTHALFSNPQVELSLQEVTSWQLDITGKLQAMVAADEYITKTPVLPSDPCLYPAAENPDFRLFFQHHAANQIKSREPAAIAAASMLINR